MKKFKVITNFSGFREAELGALGSTIITSMTGNVHFPDLTADVAACAAVHADYLTAMANAPTGGPLSKTVKAAKRDAVLGAFHILAVKVNLEAAGNKELLDTTGIPLVRERAAGKDGPLDKATGLRVDKGPVLGSLAVSIERLDDAAAYVFQYTEGAGGEGSHWINILTSDLSVVIYGLTRGGLYSVRAAGIGRDTTLCFSDAVSVYIQ